MKGNSQGEPFSSARFRSVRQSPSAPTLLNTKPTGFMEERQWCEEKRISASSMSGVSMPPMEAETKTRLSGSILRTPTESDYNIVDHEPHQKMPNNSFLRAPSERKVRFAEGFKSVTDEMDQEETKEEEYRSPSRRPPVLPNDRSSAVAPDFDDMLRRVSVIIYQHICRGERTYLGGSTTLGDITSTPPKNSQLTGLRRVQVLEGKPVGYGLVTSTFKTDLRSSSSELKTKTYTHKSKRKWLGWFGKKASARSSQPFLPSGSVNQTDSSQLLYFRGGNGGRSSPADGGWENSSFVWRSPGMSNAPPRRRVDPSAAYHEVDESLEFAEDLFLRPQWKYRTVRLPGLPAMTRPVMSEAPVVHSLPRVNEIYSFAQELFTKADLSAECSVVCLVYIERLMEKAGIQLLCCNWKPILLGGLLLSSKVWQDLATWNVEVAQVYPEYSLSSINRLERIYLNKLRYSLMVSSSVYAKYYFALRSMSKKKNFRQRYMYVLAVPAPSSKTVQDKTQEMKNTLYSKSLQA